MRGSVWCEGVGGEDVQGWRCGGFCVRVHVEGEDARGEV